MIRIWDGILSFLAAFVTAFVTGVPAWGTFRAIQSDLLPAWGWAALIALGFVGILMVLSFLRKAVRGVHPLRERRR